MSKRAMIGALCAALLLLTSLRGVEAAGKPGPQLPTASGDLDPSFGSGGALVLPSHRLGHESQLAAMATQDDGKIVAVGTASGQGSLDFLLLRYNPDGTPDLSFGLGGRVIQDFAGNDRATAVAIQPDGKILVSGSADGNIDPPEWRSWVARFNADGTVDPSFAYTSWRDYLLPRSFGGIAVDPSGSIYLVGTGREPTRSTVDFDILRLQPDGYISYNMAYSTDFHTVNAGATSVALIPTGPAAPALALAGSVGDFDVSDFAVMNYYSLANAGSSSPMLAQNSLDFFGGHDSANAVVVQPDNKVIAVGSADTGYRTGKSVFALARFVADPYSESIVPDPTFGSGGKVTTAFPYRNASASAVHLQSDGKILVAGTIGSAEHTDFGLARYNADGSLDSSFGDGGLVRSDFSGVADSASAVTVLADGSIMAVGAAGAEADTAVVAIARYSPNGQPDARFGGVGSYPGTFRMIIPGYQDQDGGASAIALQADGKVLLGAYDTQDRYSLLRLMPDGSLDPSFGQGGFVNTGRVWAKRQGDLVAVQPDGKIVFGSSYNFDGFLLRYRADGALDPTFGDGGRSDTARWIIDASAVAIQPDGKLLAGGFGMTRFNTDGRLDSTFGNDSSAGGNLPGFISYIGFDPQGRIVVGGNVGGPDCYNCYYGAPPFVARFTAAGFLDPSFGVGGIVQEPDIAVTGFALQPDGKMVAALNTDDGFILIRYGLDGARDPGFGQGGAVHIDLNAGGDASALAIQPDGRIVLAAGRLQVAMARFNPDGSLDESFGEGGTYTSTFAEGIRKVATVALDRAGRLVVAGIYGPYNNWNRIFAARYIASNDPPPTPNPAPPTPPAGPGCVFRDVCPDDYFFSAVKLLLAKGVVGGYEDNTFRPFAPATRGQLAKIITLAEGWSDQTDGGPHFSDVPADNPFYRYVETAYSHGVISGYADGAFRWQATITRGQLTKIVVLASGWPLATPAAPTFADVPASDPFFRYVETAYARAIINGYADHTFRPFVTATRGQIARVIFGPLQNTQAAK